MLTFADILTFTCTTNNWFACDEKFVLLERELPPQFSTGFGISVDLLSDPGRGEFGVALRTVLGMRGARKVAPHSFFRSPHQV